MPTRSTFTAAAWTSLLTPPNSLKSPKTKQAYVPVYYPGVPDAGRATPITVRAGEEFCGADISLQTVRAFTLRGRIIIAGCGADPQPMIYLEKSESFEQNGINPTPQGAFEIHNMVPGAYYLTAWLYHEDIECRGRQALEVSDADIDGITLTITPGVEVKGRVRVEGQLGFNVGSLGVNLSQKISGFFFNDEPWGSVKPDGSFLIKGVGDGNYELNVRDLPENYFLKSARLDGVDVLTAGVNVETKQTPGSLEIVVSANGASVDGVVSKDEQASPGATVALVPDPPHRGEKRLFKGTTTDQAGHFVLQGISPGDYKVFAWEKGEHGNYTSPDFLQPYENLGVSVHVTEGSRNSVQVDLIPARDSGQ